MTSLSETNVTIVRQMHAAGTEPEQIVAELKRRGLDQIDTVKALYESGSMSLAEAKEAVDASEVWSGQRDANDRLRNIAASVADGETDHP